MADITKDSFDETNLFSKVIMQRGRDVLDFELNEFQDILRVFMFRQFAEGLQTSANNPGSNDDGYLVVGTSAANSVTLTAGFIFCDGIPLELAADTAFAGFTTNAGAPRTDTVYLAVTEVEVADPAQVPQLGETTKRRQIQITVSVSITGQAGVPANTVAEIWEGGIHYFMIADIARATGVAAIAPGDVTDLRGLLPPSALAAFEALLASAGGASQVGYAGGPAWFDTTANPATTVELQLDKIVTDLVATAGAARVGTAIVAASFTDAPWALVAGSIASHIISLLAAVNDPYHVRSIAASTNIDQGGTRDSIILITGGVPFNLTLPAPASHKGRRIKVIDSAGVTSVTTPVTLVRAAAESINNAAASYLFQSPYGRWVIECDGTNWHITD